MPDVFLRPHHFEVVLMTADQEGTEGLSDAASFSEVSGIELTLDVEGLREGGYNTGVRRLVTGASPGDLVFKRGMTRDSSFWDWIAACMSGKYPLPYIDGEIWVYGPTEDGSAVDVAATWKFYRGLVTRVSGAPLTARGAEVPIEELRVSHEGLERVVP